LGLSGDQVELLRNCLKEKAISELMQAAGRSNRTKFRDQVLKPLLNRGLLEMTIPDKPTSSKQKYVTSQSGKELLEAVQ
jgi:ATP-dependent DNA helicase RecG